MKASELRQKNEGELATVLDQKYAKLVELKFDLAGGKTKNLKEVRSIKLDIARILTLQRQAHAAKI
jgi:ribosomal protein L29